ncbi:MAG TPA: PTS sugar transporter subunit IIA [Verrucomicrobiae bacterium]|nr:PTS sugar transporter subunit IIA [Verrucomicrobiae bacterium]
MAKVLKSVVTVGQVNKPMNNVLNQLIQLQELNFAKEEQKASSSKMPLAQLEKSIAEIRGQLPPDVAARYDRLQKRYPLAVIPLAHGSCSRCGLAVPPAVVNATKAGEQLQTCPHCGRFLYFPDTVARQPKKKYDGDRPVETGIARFSAANLMIPRLEASTREGVIAELSKALGEGGFVEDTAALTELALRREAIVSTAVEHGLAFPHVRDVEGGGLAFAVGMKEKGIKFGAADEHLSKIFFFIVIPTPATAFFLRLLAGLVRTFESTDARKELLGCDSADQMWKTLVKLTKSTVP